MNFKAFLNANPWGIANITVFYNSLEMIVYNNLMF